MKISNFRPILLALLVGAISLTSFASVAESPNLMSASLIVNGHKDNPSSDKGKSQDKGKSEDKSQGKSEEGKVPFRGAAAEHSPKIQARLANLIDEDGEATVNVIAMLNRLPDQGDEDLITKTHKGKVKHRAKFFNTLAFSVAASELDSLAENTDFEAFDIDFEVTTLLDTSREAIQVDSARAKYGFLGAGVKVGVIDTGVDETHPALAHAIRAQIDFTGEGNEDMFGHGTHVTCIIACDHETYSGVAPAADIYMAKVINSRGFGLASDIFLALEWSLVNELDVVNISLGAEVAECGTDILSAVVNEVDRLGILVVVSAGNAGPESGTILSPGCASGAMTVGATDDGVDVTFFSSRGPTAEGIVKPDIVAPGLNVFAAHMNHTFAPLHGTSMSTPHIAGLAALTLEASPALTVTDIKAVIKNNAKDLLLDENTQGAGLAQALATLDALTIIVPPEPPEDEDEDEDDNGEKPPKDEALNAFGKCISEAAKAKEFDKFAECRVEFDKGKLEEAEGELPEDEQETDEEAEVDEIDVEELGEEDTPEEDLIAFKDTDDSEWFYSYVAILKAYDCVQGYGTGDFKPAQAVTFGESLKFVSACLLDSSDLESPTGHWATGYGEHLRSNFKGRISGRMIGKINSSLVKLSRLNETMNRANLIELVVSALADEVPEASEAPFEDVDLDHASVDAIAYALELGIISGDEGNLFNPDKPVNRAEVAKIIVIAREAL